jgi:hypothetical protein
MPDYDVGITVDGWVRLRISAENRNDAARKVAAACVKFQLVDSKHEAIGRIPEDGCPLFNVTVEDIEVYQPGEETRYHAPARESVDLT